MKKKLTSRKFWMGLIGALAPLINAIAGRPLLSDDIIAAIAVIIAYILAEAGADIANRKGNNDD